MATQGKVYLQYKGTINTSPSDHVIFNIEEKDPFKNSLIETMGKEKKRRGMYTGPYYSPEELASCRSDTPFESRSIIFF